MASLSSAEIATATGEPNCVTEMGLVERKPLSERFETDEVLGESDEARIAGPDSCKNEFPKRCEKVGSRIMPLVDSMPFG